MKCLKSCQTQLQYARNLKSTHFCISELRLEILKAIINQTSLFRSSLSRDISDSSSILQDLASNIGNA